MNKKVAKLYILPDEWEKKVRPRGYRGRKKPVYLLRTLLFFGCTLAATNLVLMVFFTTVSMKVTGVFAFFITGLLTMWRGLQQ